MIVLDTNVLSGLMRPELIPEVVAWLDNQPSESVWTTAVCTFEVRMGLALLAKGRKRKSLEKSFDRVLTEALQSRVLPLSDDAAVAAAGVAAALHRAGRRGEIRDLLIAGIVRQRNATLATRNT